MLNLWRRCTARSKRATVRGNNTKVVLGGTKVAHDSEAVVLKVVTLYVTLISIRTILVGMFILYFILSMKANLVTIVSLPE